MEEINFKEKLAQIINNSNLENKQKILWQIFIKEASEDENEAVFEAVSGDEENLKLLTEHLYEKVRELV